jgi:hypothetical protein
VSFGDGAEEEELGPNPWSPSSSEASEVSSQGSSWAHEIEAHEHSPQFYQHLPSAEGDTPWDGGAAGRGAPIGTYGAPAFHMAVAQAVDEHGWDALGADGVAGGGAGGGAAADAEPVEPPAEGASALALVSACLAGIEPRLDALRALRDSPALKDQRSRPAPPCPAPPRPR